MKIRITTAFKTYLLKSEDEVSFERLKKLLMEGVTDEHNRQAIYWNQDNKTYVFPALLLKNSVIEILNSEEEDEIRIL